MTTPHDVSDSRLVGMDGSRIRASFGDELRNATGLDLAISRIRLDTLGSIPAHLGRLDSIRVLLGEVRAEVIDAEAHALALRPVGRERVRILARLLQEGRTWIRAAPLGGWSPDYSVFRRASNSTALVGSHAFGRGIETGRPVMAVRMTGDDVAALASEFDRAWSRAHDVTGAVEVMLRRALRWSTVHREPGMLDPGSAA